NSMHSLYPKVLLSSSPHVWHSAVQCVVPSSRQCAQAQKVSVFRYPADWAVLIWAVPSSTVKVVCHCTPCAPILSLVSSKPKPHTAVSASKYGFTAETSLTRNWQHRKQLSHQAVVVVADAVDHAVGAAAPHRVHAQALKEARANAYPTSRKIP